MQNDSRPAHSSIGFAHSAAQPELNAPTFTAPDSTIPQIEAYDLTGPGIDLRAPFAADPLLPDLTDYVHPENLSIYPDPALSVDPFQADLLHDDCSANLATIHALEEPDPLLPDLQHPDLTQQVHMQQRPGELDSSAVQDLHQDATYQQLGQKMYPDIFMDQSGVNTSRSRHMDLLMRGLDAQEP